MPDWGEFLVSLGTLSVFAFLPGVFLTCLVFPGKRLDILERIPVGFGLVCGLLAGLFFTARALAWGWRTLLAVWLALILVLIGIIFILRLRNWGHSFADSRWGKRLDHALPRVAMYDEQMADRPAAPLLIGVLLTLLGLGAFLSQSIPTDQDDWMYFATVRDFADVVRFAPPMLNDRNIVHAWWLVHAAIVRVFDVDVVRLGQNWMPLIFVPVSLLAFYALARALFLNRNLAIAAVIVQFGYLVADCFNPDEWVPWPGWWFFGRIDQDHTIALFLLLPVFATLVVWYLREGGWTLLGAISVAQFGLLAVHALLGIVLSALTLFAVLVIEFIFVRQTHLGRRVLWLGVLTLFVFGGLWLAQPRVFGLMPPSLSALHTVSFGEGNFPFSYYRYTFFSPTTFTLRIDFLGQPPALAALVLTLWLIPFLRSDVSARYLFAASVGLLLAMYCPPVAEFLESRMSTTVYRLWNWNPKALVMAYFLPSFYWIGRGAWQALRRRVWSARVWQAGAGLGCLIVLLAILPAYLRRDFPPALVQGRALPNGTYAILNALREQTRPGEYTVVFAYRDITDAIPAYRATLRPVLFREDPQGQQRLDADQFFGSGLVTNTHLAILNGYHVGYLIVSGNRELSAQCDLLPEYFQPLYRNIYGVLYRVKLPLESNALIEANTVSNHGEWEGAIQAYNAVLADNPDDSLAHTGLGIVLKLLDKPRAAAREFEAALSAAPTNAQAHYHLVSVYQKLGMLDQAAQHIAPAGRLMESGDAGHPEK